MEKKQKFMPHEYANEMKFLPHELVSGPGSAHNEALQGQYLNRGGYHEHKRGAGGHCLFCGKMM